MTTAPSARLDVRDVVRSLRVSRSTDYELVRRGLDFPRPIKIGSSTRWLQQDIDAYVHAKRRNAAIEDLL